MRADLCFQDRGLEGEFVRQTKARRRGVAVQFGVFRCGVLVLVALKALLQEKDVPGCLALVLGAASCLVPMLAVQEVWHWACVVDDILQAVVGCWCHHLIAPSRAGIWPAASLFYLLGGSSILWAHMYCLFSFLPFSVRFVSQAAVCQVLLAGSRHMCTCSPGLLTAYRTLAALLRWVCGPQLSQLLVLTVRGRGAAAAAAGTAAGSRDVLRCMSGQAAVLLLPVFVGATFATYRRELDERRAFLAAAREASPQREIRPEVRSAAAASPLDFASFAVPALAAMYIYGIQ
ncbi:hypothetical protein ABPG75_007468 [Micractinium tetrahymenae]